jgi:hypothetical protein
MRRTSGWAIIALLIAGSAGIGANQKRFGGAVSPPEPSVADKVDPKIAALIADLGSEDYRTREKAGRDLAALGEKALPAMRTVLLSTENAEVQRRLVVLVRKMDNDRLVAPKRVTFNFKDKTVKEALDEISKQTNYKIEFSGGGGGFPGPGGGGPGGGGDSLKHNFDFENTPFWVAVDKCAAMAGCIVFADYNDDTIRVYNQDSLNPHVAYAGPFRFLATNINSNKSIQLSGISKRGGNMNRNEYLNFSFQIQSEPKNPMLGITQAEVITATDDLGSSLVPPKDPNNRSYYENRGMRGHNTYGNLNLNRNGDKAATSIKTLKGKVGIILLAGTAPEIVITDPLKQKAKTFVGRTVEIEFGSFAEDANNKKNYTLEVTMKKLGEENPQQVDYNWANNIWERIELIDAAGNRYQAYGPNNFNNNGASVQMTVLYGPDDRRTGKTAKLGPPVKLVVNEWLSVTHEVTFEFKDIPLP